jgi:hypothetical protein
VRMPMKPKDYFAGNETLTTCIILALVGLLSVGPIWAQGRGSIAVSGANAAQDGGVSDGGSDSLPDGGVDSLPAMRTRWPLRAVNSPLGVSCPALFDGGQGLCAPKEGGVMRDLVEALHVHLPRIPSLEQRVQQAEALAMGRAQQAKDWEQAYRARGAALENCRLANERCNARAEKLSETLAKASNKTSLWQLVVAFLIGGATAIGMAYGLRGVR